jgi:3'-5' exoribonuclease
MKETSLKQRIGEEVTQFFIIRDIEVRTKKTDNTPYIVLELGYPAGRIWANIWEDTEAFLAEYQQGDIIKIQGIIELYKEQAQIRIIKRRKDQPADNVRPEDLLPVYSGDYEALKKRLPKVIKEIKDQFLQKLCEMLLLDTEFGEQFCLAPGGKLWHHEYIGGLLEHTLAMVDLCAAISERYPYINRDLLRTGALLHDIGKVESYQTVPFIEYSDEGRLIGHVVLGYQRVQETINNIPDFPQETAKQLLHLILSHQGSLENASPVIPMTSEGIILYFADQIDSNLNAFQRIIAEQKSPRKRWSNYVNIINRFIYFGESE